MPLHAPAQVGTVQGMIEPDAMLAYLMGCVERHGAMLVAQRAELQVKNMCYTCFMLYMFWHVQGGNTF